MRGRCPVSMMSRQFTGGGQAHRGAQGEKGQRHQSQPCRGIILQSLMRRPVSSRTVLALAFLLSREAGRTLCPPVVSQATTQNLVGIQVMTPASLSPLPVAGERVLSSSELRKPLMKATWGQWRAPGPGHTFNSKVWILFF